ncbi:transcriptional regulator [Tolypothrix tenuis PCC 7101]|uniref:Transcriptional regulator n=1 Tax=Tolypothrix tenuis PCC 7101 TaxID=231146 RepID=A0A1Z4NAS1_9CYAN|nr:heavy metal-responsive transcriptional regulator [Aulosira sp. FACHB-113]BAZ02811.1 transcriptional regulator [Tolypothrix tenuis PCC 7101]BAZ78295.1 transcriptional regulator [Aulosira laxa NIES-50]
MLQVGEVCRKMGLNPQTIYFYERIELIPAPKRTESGYRLFSDKDVERLSFISRAKALGMSLDEIKDILKLKDGRSLTCQAMQARLLKKLQEIEDNIRQLQGLRDELLPLVDRCRQNANHPDPSHECVVLEESE